MYNVILARGNQTKVKMTGAESVEHNLDADVRKLDLVKIIATEGNLRTVEPISG